MAEFKAKLNPFTGTLQLVPTNIVLAFKAAVATQASLPLTGNAKGDARLANDTGHLYVWSIDATSGLLTDWADAGDIVDLNWSAISGKPSSTPTQIDQAVTDDHTHLNKSELDKVTDGDHDVRTDNPHSVTKTQISLGNVTDDAQVKRSEIPDLGSINLIRNGGFEIWSSGALALPDNWTDVDTGVFARESTIIKAGTYSFKLTADAASAKRFSQDVDLSKGLEYWKGKQISLSCWAKTNENYIFYLRLYDGIDNHSSIVHTGSGNWERLTLTANINAAATQLKVYLWIEPSATTPIVYVDEVMVNEGALPLVCMPVVKDDTDIASAIALKHTQNSDSKLDNGGVNEITAATLKGHVESISNPHSVTKTQVGLGNVDNKSEATIITDVKADVDVADALSKRHAASGQFNQATAAEISGLTDKATPVDADVILGEDSAHVTPFSKIKITWSNIKVTLKSYFDGIYQAALGFTAVPDTRTVNTHALSGNVTVVADDIPTSESGLTVQDKLDTIVNPMLYKGGITLAADFPTLALVKTGWTYTILADVTDNDASKTNSGQSFLQNAEIAWNGTNWTQLGYSAVKSVAGKTGIVTLAKADVGLSNVTDGAKPPSMCIAVFERTTSVTIGDGKADIVIPSYLNGMNLVRAQAVVITAGTTNATTIAIYNATDSQEMLSANISIASGDTVGTVGTIDTAHDDVATNDVLRIDVDAVSTTAPQGLLVILEFA